MTRAFRSSRVVTPRGVVAATIVAEHGRITSVNDWSALPHGATVHEYGDLVLLPGLVDSHVHINEPGRTEWEGFDTATQAAASGGVTTVVDMPLNCVPETISVQALKAKRAAANGKVWVDWAAWGGVVPGNSDDITPLTEAGVPGFKCFMIHSGIDGFQWVDEHDLRKALLRLQGTRLPLLAHAEVPGPVQAATDALNRAGANWRTYTAYLASRPDKTEMEAIELLIRLAEEFQTPIHIVHLSSAAALPLLAMARRRGVPITVETCTHYLWFAAEDIPDGATEYKCAPPIRGAANREQLWTALTNGVIDMVTTDHSPCVPAMKRREDGRWNVAWGGVASLGLTLPVLWTAMAERGLGGEPGLTRIAEWLSMAPARLAGMTAQKGSIQTGADADLVVFDPEAEWTVAESDLHFRHKLTPYLGAKLRGCILETWLRGAQVFDGSAIQGSPRGREWVRP